MRILFYVLSQESKIQYNSRSHAMQNEAKLRSQCLHLSIYFDNY